MYHMYYHSFQVDTISRFYWSSFFADKVIIFQLSDAKIDIVFTPR